MMMRNMLQGVTQQLIHADRGLYLSVWVVRARKDHETKLISYPYCARYYTKEMDTATLDIDFAFVQSDIPVLKGKAPSKVGSQTSFCCTN